MANTERGLARKVFDKVGLLLRQLQFQVKLLV